MRTVWRANGVGIRVARPERFKLPAFWFVAVNSLLILRNLRAKRRATDPSNVPNVPKTAIRQNRVLCQNSISYYTNVYFPVDIAPFLGLAKSPNQFLKSFRILRSVFKPCQKIKRLANITAMIELPCNRR